MARTVLDYLADLAERPYLAAFLGGTPDPTARARYAAWLASRGDPRAELVLALSELLEGVPDERSRHALALRVRALAPAFDPAWLRTLVGPAPVRNCGAGRAQPSRLRFALECPEAWVTMRPTGDAGVRRCERCDADVVRCADLATAERHALAGACIALDASAVAAASARYCRDVTGRPDVFAMWADRLFAE